jgi:hypothetical membrane protein
MTLTANADTSCEPDQRVTKSLLGYGVIAGPIYVLVSLTQALTRDGFDPGRHAWSLLSNGNLGWLQIANFCLTGLMTVAAAIGLRRATGPGRWAPRLVGAYGVAMVAAGVFRADPAMGFPPGTPADFHDVSWHGTLHLVAGGLGFIGVVAACLILGSRFAAENRSGWALFSRLTGVLFLAGFIAIASASGSAAAVLAFTAAVILISAWLSAVSVHFYRRVR